LRNLDVTWHGNRRYAGRHRRGDARRGVLDRDTGSEVDAEQSSGCQIGLGVGLAMLNDISGDDRGEAAFRQVAHHGRRPGTPTTS